MIRTLLLALCLAVSLAAQPPVYVLLWFDTEDYVDPRADDAVLRIARDLDELGIRATFKVVGEKARVLESRGRWDVIRALSLHDIGYHSNFHSLPPVPSAYLRELGFLEGAEEFRRREGPGAADVRRIFGVVPSCYGQPGSSWGPQSNPALRAMGIGVYLDEGSQVGVDDQPFWYGGLLHVFHMGRFLIRPSLDVEDRLPQTLAEFQRAAEELEHRGGGVISSYFHPTEFVNAEFWDAVNFARGANPERAAWKLPRRRSPEEAERCFRILRTFAARARQVRGVRFVTARDLLQLYRGPLPPFVERGRLAAHLSERIRFLDTGGAVLSPADMLLTLLGVEPQYADGPVARKLSTWEGETIPRAAFEHAKADAASYIRVNHRLPAAVWLGSRTLSLADFAATLAADEGSPRPSVTVRKGTLEFEKYFNPDPVRGFDWLIHPAGFRAPELMELGRLQGWTLKPARLR